MSWASATGWISGLAGSTGSADAGPANAISMTATIAADRIIGVVIGLPYTIFVVPYQAAIASPSSVDLLNTA